MPDTIAAIATARGKGAIGVVKVSGPQSPDIAREITGQHLPPRMSRYLAFKDVDDQPIDRGVALLFQGPDSYTGEDVLELQAHGNQFVLDQLLQRVIALGARHARPGEFTERAFLNDKLDLAQAEAVADLIDSDSTEAARAAVRSLSGDFSQQVSDITDRLLHLRVYIEAALDFAEEEIDFLADESLTIKLLELDQLIDNTLARATEGRVLREGLNVVIVGQPNVGKSSLLNALTQQQSAIVTDIAGTTRDVLREHIVIDGLPIHLVDTAGIRESADKVEQEGVRRAREQVKTADLVLAIGVAGCNTTLDDTLFLDADSTVLNIYNKADLNPLNEQQIGLPVSAKTGDGIDALKAAIKLHAGYQQSPEGAFMARRRHLRALEQTREHVVIARSHLLENSAGELAAEELRAAQLSLSQITGEFSADDLLGEIFGKFCIGK
ncbi:MAG: tRNA uridine-5-carboxymethylaminomethyl(34) synthesis GTPase MnmE [Pseudomonadota bacterium]